MIPIYSNKIHELHFHVLGSEEVQSDSNFTVTNKETFRTGEYPVAGGVYDAHGGTTDFTWNCITCGNVKGVCPGHSGQIILKYPVKNPLFRDQILRWLKIICMKCGNILIKKNPVGVSRSKLLVEFGKLCKTVSACEFCGEKHPTINKDKYRQSVFYIDVNTVSGKEPKFETLYNHDIMRILERISNETVQRAGILPESHPKKFILDRIKVPPNTIRPDIRRIGNKSNSSDITSLAKTIVRLNASLPDVIPEKTRIEIDKDLRERYHNLDMVYFEMIKGSSGSNNQVRMITSTNKVPTSIASRIPKKEGRIRGNLMGKRVKEMARSVITGDSFMEVDELGIPIEIATAISIPETVSQLNKDRLNIYFMNRRNNYPGCSRIIKASNKKSYNIDHLEQNYQLQIGDIIMRDLINGDIVNFNRQPSLLWSNISAHRIVVMTDALTFRINPSVCACYNARNGHSQ